MKLRFEAPLGHRMFETSREFHRLPLLCDHHWFLDEVGLYVGETYPSLFLECFAGASGTTLSLLLDDRVQRGILVVGDPYLAAFWREALKTDSLIHKAAKFNAIQATVEEVVNNPDRDPAFWTLVKSQCSWQGRLDRKAFLEWNVTKAWKREGILESLSKVRSLSNRLDVIEGQGVEVLESYGEATAFLQYPFSPYDKWNEALRQKCIRNWSRRSSSRPSRRAKGAGSFPTQARVCLSGAKQNKWVRHGWYAESSPVRGSEYRFS